MTHSSRKLRVVVSKPLSDAATGKDPMAMDAAENRISVRVSLYPFEAFVSDALEQAAVVQ